MSGLLTVTAAIAAALGTVVWWWLLKPRAQIQHSMPSGQGDDAVAEAPSMALRLVLALFITAIVAGGYAWVGTPGGLALGPGFAETAMAQNAAAQSASSAQNPQAATRSPEQVAALLDQLSARMKQNPSDPEGWAILARASFTVGRVDAAVEAFAQATRLRPDDAELLVDYANALATKNQRQLGGEPSQLIDRALKLDPNNIKALALAGMAAMQRQEPAQAVLAWEKLTALSPPDSPVVQALASDLAQARQQASTSAQGKPADSLAPASLPSSAPASAATSQRTTVQISGTVSLSPALKDQVAPDDTVFIYARAVQGPRMPLALVRKKVSDLPFEFVLDDANAMSPAMRLSSVQQLEVIARISKTGQAQAQSGDAQVLVAPVALGATGVALVITSRLP